MDKLVIIVRLDIFKDIGFGHLSRLQRLAEIDQSRDYILVYRTDLENVKKLFRNCFKETIEIKDDFSKFFSNFDNQNSQLKQVQISDWEKTKLIIEAISFCNKIYMIIIDNFLINNFWIEEMRSDSLWKNLKLVNIDDCNKYYNNVELTINYSKEKNKLVEQGNTLIAEGLYYCPFSNDLVMEREKRINYKSLDKFNSNLLLSFGLFDEFDYCEKILNEFFESIDNLNITVLIGKEAKSSEKIFKKYQFKKNIKIITYTHNVLEIYQNIFFGIGNFGLMSLEKAYLGIPQINFVESENQIKTAEILIENNLSYKFDQIQDLNKYKFDKFKNQFPEINQNLLHTGDDLFGKGIIEWLILIDKLSE
tara:strand:- start:6823 stop:7914 length:1092 start_codon:yes stop_codon:yes gene_type:complete